MANPRFDKILVAMRGEAASHVIRTAQQMGLRTAAIFSGDERNLPYVYLADEAWCLDLDAVPAAEAKAASSTSIRGDRIFAIADACGAQAVHPGYGNLSLDLEFAEECFRRSLIFIGSTPASIEFLQSKTVTRFVVEDAQVPLVPGYHGAEQSLPVLLAKAESVGFPLLIRCDVPDGGAATRVAESAESLPSEIASAQRSLQKLGVKDRLLLERLIPDARQVEIPVFIDQHGNGIYFPERDCSLRHQRQALILESPASTLPERVRKALGEAALRCARTLQCVGGVTASFVLDPHDGFYFSGLKPNIEVDSHLTDLVTSQKLVEWQLRIACGEPLPCAQSSLPRLGHGFEANIYTGAPCETESAVANRTQPQRIRLWHRPDHVSQVELNELYQTGTMIGASSDAPIARLYAWDDSRPQALQRLQSALRATSACGIATNLDYLHRVCSLPEFAEALVTTRFTAQHWDKLCAPPPMPSAAIVHMAAIAWLAREQIRQIPQSSSRPVLPHEALPHEASPRETLPLESLPRERSPRDMGVIRLKNPQGEAHSLELAWNNNRYVVNIECTPDGYRLRHEQVEVCIRASYFNDTFVLDLGTRIEKAKIFSDNDLSIVFKDGLSYLFYVSNHTRSQISA